jgi:small subunit ribosomal protein S4
MARYIGAGCKKCRRLDMKLFLKGTKCYTNCIFDRWKTDTPSRGRYRSKPSEYKIRLQEKQRARNISGVMERQFNNLFHKASRIKGKTGDLFLRFLETRLDNIVRRLGFAVSLKNARQLVLHGHIKVNGKKVDIPSYQVKVGDEVTLTPAMTESVVVKQGLEHMEKRSPRASFLEYNADKFSGKLIRWPDREEMSYPVNEQLIVEYYSK